MKNVITHSGLGNQKDLSELPEGMEWKRGLGAQKGVTFVVVNGVDWYIRDMEYGIGMEDSRRNHIRQIQAALDMDEMQYYEPIEEYDFTQMMVDWSRMNHAEPPKKFVRRSSNKEGQVFDALKDVLGGMQKVQTYKREVSKVGRNEPCPCGSGSKFKKCCGRNL